MYEKMLIACHYYSGEKSFAKRLRFY